MTSRRRSFGVQNKTTTLGTSALIALGGMSCSSSTPPTPATSTGTTAGETTSAPLSGSAIANGFASTPTPNSETIPKEDATVVAQRFAGYAVTLPKIARRTLYTWTKTDQVEALAKDPTLLTRAESPEFGTSFFEQILDQRAKKNEKLAQLLRSAPFAKQRYAWTAPFATSRGIGGESYGNELIKMELKPDAWFAIVKVSSPDITVVDMNDNPVKTEDVLANPQRLAAAYFVQDKPAVGYAASMAGPNDRVGYREYVVLNESMIASYSVGTPEIAAELETEIQVLEGLLRYLKTHTTQVNYFNKWMVEVTTTRWTSPPDLSSPIATYEAAIAFADYDYHPDERSLGTLIETLRQRKLRDKPFQHEPKVGFAKPK